MRFSSRSGGSGSDFNFSAPPSHHVPLDVPSGGHPRGAEARPAEVSATGWIAAKRMNSQVEVLGFVFPPEPAMKSEKGNVAGGKR